MAPAIVRRARDVLVLLPPDFSAPESHLKFRFPPLGPAVVAACIAEDGLHSHALDLALDVFQRPLDVDASMLADGPRIERHLAGARDEAIDAAVEPILLRLEPHRNDCELVAISVDRGSQAPLVALLSVELKRRWRRRIIVGGVSVDHVRQILDRAGVAGADVVTHASTPPQIRRAFEALSAMPQDRSGPPIETNDELVQLVRGGMRKAPSALDWPVPDFSIYDLSLYQRDPVPLTVAPAPAYQGEIGRSLVLPYFFAFECQFSCAFCQTGGTQENKPAAQVVAELGALSERYQVREFLFFNAQSNLLAAELSRELLAARLDLRWSDSYRVRPSEPGDLELMAKAGCAGLTVGVESASERVLKAMVKGHRPEHATKMIREVHRNEIMLRVNLLTCFPGETTEDLALTADWLQENAFAIDDIAASSFYLTADSPLGRKPERFGVRIRGPRALEGRTRFRKSPDSLAYDEVDGMTWEEREPLLEQSEELLRGAWLAGRGPSRTTSFSPSSMLQFRRHFSTKSEIYETIDGWRNPPVSAPSPSPPPPPPPPPVPLRPKLVAPRKVTPPTARAFATAYRAAIAGGATTFRAGDTSHVLLFADGGYLFFRGTVTRDRGIVVESFSIEEPIAPVGGPAGLDDRSTLLVRGARLDVDATGTWPFAVAFELLTFRADPDEPPYAAVGAR